MDEFEEMAVFKTSVTFLIVGRDLTSLNINILSTTTEPFLNAGGEKYSMQYVVDP